MAANRSKCFLPVSYTHLDVYKRQGALRFSFSCYNTPEEGAAAAAIVCQEVTCLLYTSALIYLLLSVYKIWMFHIRISE